MDGLFVNDAPPGGITSGATVVTLRGLGFDVGPVLFCRFGEGKAQRAPVLEYAAEYALCAAPATEQPGDVHVLLSNDDIVYIDTGLDYTYYVQPSYSIVVLDYCASYSCARLLCYYRYYVQPSTFTDVSPQGGPKRGGTAVTLTGEGFAGFVSLSQPLSADKKRSISRCLWGGEFSSSLTVAGIVRNQPRTSPPAPCPSHARPPPTALRPFLSL